MVGRAPRSTIKGQPEVVSKAAKRRLVRELLFLIRLHHEVNFNVIENQRVWSLSIAALAGMQQNILTENSFRDLLGYIRCYIESYSYHTSPYTDEDIRHREQLLNSLRLWHSQRNQEAKLIVDWKNIAQRFLIELYGFQGALASISKRYFDCHQVLFPDLEQVLTDIVKNTEEMVGMLNDTFHNKSGKDSLIDLEELHKVATREAAEQISYLVDLAKAETLQLLGERQAAAELAARHL
ncbi:hypothetical protein ACFLUN_00785 [Chloroflexota bacterium]